MSFGDIIKRSWRITWRYKALWVLGLFAGLSGCQGSSGGNGGGNNSGRSFNDLNSFDLGRMGSSGLSSAEQFLTRALPVIVAVGLLLIAFALLWSIAAVAARAALVVGVDDADRGVRRPLGQLWSEGFHHFWPTVGLGILLKLPVLAAGLVLAALIVVPIVGAIAGGGDPTPAAFLPFCGVLAIGLPLVIVGSFILDVMYLLGLRYLVLGNQGVFESAGNAWKFFRARFKDTFLLYIINGALNIAGSIVLAIPLVALGLAIFLPMAIAVRSEQWGVLAVPISIFVLVVTLLAFLYTGVMGTFTSGLWTLFFRDVMAPAAAVAAAKHYPSPGSQPAAYPPAEPYFAPPQPMSPAGVQPVPPAPPVVPDATAYEPPLPAPPVEPQPTTPEPPSTDADV